MTTKKQILANRNNAKKSTGPRNTSLTRFNAVKHGMTSRQPVVFQGESKEEYDKLCECIKNKFSPQDEVEKELVNQIALCMLRLRRGRLAESAVVDSFIDLEGNVDWCGVFKGDYLLKIGRYEKKVMRKLQKLLEKFGCRTT